MVCLTPRFLFLAALVATVAMPSYVLQSDARAVDVAARHHGAKSSVSHSAPVTAKGKGKAHPKPVIPLPPSANGKTIHGKKPKKHRKGGKKNEKRGMSQGDEAQTTFSLKKRAVSPPCQTDATAKEAAATSDNTWDPLDPLLQIGTIQIGDGRGGSYSKTHDLIDTILKRSPHHRHDHDEVIVNGNHDHVHYDRRSPHHHHGHHSHDKVIVNGDHDDVHYHDRRTSHRGGNMNERREPHHHHHHHGHYDHDKVVVNGNNDDVHYHDRRTVWRDGFGASGNFNERRAPHHHHHHHGHHDHGKTVVNGNNDDVHVHGRREPHHHHHHHHHGEHKTVINGNNDNVHVHGRHINSDESTTVAALGLQLGIRRSIADGASTLQWNSSDDRPGVPGTVDIMVVGGLTHKKLASLVLSSVPDSSTTNSTSALNDTKAALDPDASPFVLDASNKTQTQFFLVVSSPPAGMPSGSLTKTFAALKAAVKDSGDDDIKVTLQVPIFEAEKAAMRQYCATYDPNPTMAAPLYMERCFDHNEASGKISDASMHKSQTFAYNPGSGTVRPMWFGISPPASANATDPSANLTDAGSNPSSNATSGLDKQMNFKIPTSNKDALVPIPVSASNATQTANGTAPALPAGTATAPKPDGISPQNVTLVFTPAAPAVHEVNSTSETASFGPADGSGSSNLDADSGDDDDADDSSSTSTTLGAAMTTDSSNPAKATDSGAPNVSAVSAGKADSRPTTTSGGASSDATDMMSATSSSSSLGSESMMSWSTASGSTAVPTPTSTIDQAAIEKMYQEGPHIV